MSSCRWVDNTRTQLSHFNKYDKLMKTLFFAYRFIMKLYNNVDVVFIVVVFLVNCYNQMSMLSVVMTLINF